MNSGVRESPLTGSGGGALAVVDTVLGRDAVAAQLFEQGLDLARFGELDDAQVFGVFDLVFRVRGLVGTVVALGRRFPVETQLGLFLGLGPFHEVFFGIKKFALALVVDHVAREPAALVLSDGHVFSERDALA